MVVQEGRATVSTDLSHAARWATTTEKRHHSKSLTTRDDDEIGRIFVIQVPEDLHLGYGMFTSEKIDETNKEIKGAPIKYASGRKQLAFYRNNDTETSRRQIESEHTLGQAPRHLILPPKTIIASIYPSRELRNFCDRLQEHVRSFDMADIAQYSENLTQVLVADSRNAFLGNSAPDKIAQQLVASTIESVAISRIRNLALDVMRALGYSVIKEDGQVDITAVDPAKVMQRVQELYQKSHSETFHLGPEWLQKYLKDQSEKMLTQLGIISYLL